MDHTPHNGGKVKAPVKSESKTRVHTALQAQSGSSVNTPSSPGQPWSSSGTASKATSQAVQHGPATGPGGVADKRKARPGIAIGGNAVGDVRKRNPMGNQPKNPNSSRHVPAGAKRTNTGNVS
jgi:hypothetical protein